MKRKFWAIPALLLALSLTACSPKLDAELLDSSQPPVIEEQPADTPAALPAEDAPAVDGEEELPPRDLPVTEPEEEIVEAPPMICEPTEGADGVTMAVNEVLGGYEEIVSFSLQQPEFSGLATEEADAKINEFYGKLVQNLNDYAYNTVYKTAQDRHTGAHVSGVVGVMPTEGNGSLRIGYVLTVHYADAEEDEVHERIDVFDWSTGELLESEK